MFHLHGFHQRQGLTGNNLLADPHQYLQDLAGHGRIQATVRGLCLVLRQRIGAANAARPLRREHVCHAVYPIYIRMPFLITPADMQCKRRMALLHLQGVGFIVQVQNTLAITRVAQSA